MTQKRFAKYIRINDDLSSYKDRFEKIYQGLKENKEPLLLRTFLEMGRTRTTDFLATSDFISYLETGIRAFEDLILQDICLHGAFYVKAAMAFPTEGEGYDPMELMLRLETKRHVFVATISPNIEKDRPEIVYEFPFKGKELVEQFRIAPQLRVPPSERECAKLEMLADLLHRTDPSLIERKQIVIFQPPSDIRQVARIYAKKTGVLFGETKDFHTIRSFEVFSPNRRFTIPNPARDSDFSPLGGL